MRDVRRADTASPPSFLPRRRESTPSNNGSSGGSDPTRRADLATANSRQRPRRGSNATDTLESTSNSTSRTSVGGCSVSAWTNALPNVVGGTEKLAGYSHLNSLSSSGAAAALNHPPGISTLPSADFSHQTPAVDATSGTSPTFRDASVAFGALTRVAPNDAAISEAYRGGHYSTHTPERAVQASTPGASSVPATPKHDGAPCAVPEPRQGSSLASLHLYVPAPAVASTTTRGDLSNPPRRRGLMPPPVMNDATSASVRRSCSCPSTRSTTAPDAAVAPSRGANFAGAAAAHPTHALRGSGSQSSPVGMRPQASVSPTTPNFKPLGMWSASPSTVVNASASASATTQELKASTEATNATDVGSLLTYELDGGAVILDPLQTPDDLVCGVCMSVCVRPTATTCGHLFCRRCLQSWMQANPTSMCPLDRTPIQVELLRTDARAQRQINALRCCCPASLSPALQSKLWQLGSAKNARGDRAAERAEGSSGETRGSGCARRTRPLCSWTGCVSDAAEHLRQCPLIIIVCPFVKRGCTAVLPRAEMARHLKRCVADHLLLVSQALDASTEECRALQGEVEVLRRRCCMSYPDTAPTVPTDSSAGNSEPTVSVSSSSLHVAAANAAAVPGVDVVAATLAPALAITGIRSGGMTPMSMTALQEEVTMGGRSLPRVGGLFDHAASTAVDYTSPALSQPSPLPYQHPHRRSSTSAAQTNVRRHAATEDMLLVDPRRAPSGHEATTPMPADPTPQRAPSPLRQGTPQVSVSVANANAAAQTFALAAAAAALLPNRVSNAPSPAATLLGSGYAVDRFVWVIMDVTSLQEPCYSRPFTSHSLPWYVGIDATVASEQCGVYLFAEGHEHRVDFRVILYHGDPARDVVHVVRDWQEDYIGKGWGPLRFINRFTLEQDGFLVRGCLRVGIEVLSMPY
ncbi:hypothetical protein LSCM1_07294 [Leishmania martiniquensis]|uniref:RING-type domain-containing protein n=1 Tax=Leishmania martiniquensis TaxID=1580590 RepID=A0A836I0D9_9TRYP|nr:hypothetical protein LSCM1_07294 [Leishmania martiniquensis]